MNILINHMAVLLCRSDIACGYIPISPVLDNRDQLIKEQFQLYQNILNTTVIDLFSKYKELTNYKIQEYLLLSAIELTSGDIISEYISVEPVLYNRTDKIKERFVFYFDYIYEVYLKTGNNNIFTSEQHNNNLNSENVNNHTKENNFIKKNKHKKKNR